MSTGTAEVSAFDSKQKEAEGQSLRLVISAMESIRHSTGSAQLTLSQMLVLLTIGARGEVPQSDLEALTQSSGATVSRILFTQLGPDGLNLVSTHMDALSRRKRLAVLTPRGLACIKSLQTTVLKRLELLTHGNPQPSTSKR